MDEDTREILEQVDGVWSRLKSIFEQIDAEISERPSELPTHHAPEGLPIEDEHRAESELASPWRGFTAHSGFSTSRNASMLVITE